MFFSGIIFSIIVTLSVFFISCNKNNDSSGSADVTPQLLMYKSLSTSSVNSEHIRLSAASGTGMATVTSFRAPIREIYLENSSSGMSSKIYSCAANTNDGCLVELASGTALQDLLSAGAVAVSAGTYDRVRIATCQDEGSYTSKVIASATIGSTTYYTTATGLSTTGPAVAVTLPFSGCALSVMQPVATTINAGDSLQFKLYFDNRDLVWIGEVGGPGWLPGGCSGSGNSSAFICAGYPTVTGTIDTVTPTIQRYRVNGIGTFGIILNSSNNFIGGYTRRYYNGNGSVSGGTLNFNADTPISVFTSVSTSLYKLFNYGSSSDTSTGYFMTQEWQMTAIGASFTGNATSQDGTAGTFQATRLD